MEGVAFGELEANISFTNSKAVYFSKKGGKNIEVQITNVPKVKLIISKIYENNLLTPNVMAINPQERRNGPEYASYEEMKGIIMKKITVAMTPARRCYL